MDLILDADGSFTWVQGPYSAPMISTSARRPALDQAHPVHGSSPDDPDAEEVSAKAEDLGDPLDPAGAGAPHLEVDPAAWAFTQFATARRAIAAALSCW
jgi:hypothetical protein